MLSFRARLLIKLSFFITRFLKFAFGRKINFFRHPVYKSSYSPFQARWKGLKNSTNRLHGKISAENTENLDVPIEQAVCFCSEKLFVFTRGKCVTCFGVMRDSAVAVRDAYAFSKMLLLNWTKILSAFYKYYYINIANIYNQRELHAKYSIFFACNMYFSAANFLLWHADKEYKS